MIGFYFIHTKLNIRLGSVMDDHRNVWFNINQLLPHLRFPKQSPAIIEDGKLFTELYFKSTLGYEYEECVHSYEGINFIDDIQVMKLIKSSITLHSIHDFICTSKRIDKRQAIWYWFQHSLREINTYQNCICNDTPMMSSSWRPVDWKNCLCNTTFTYTIHEIYDAHKLKCTRKQ